MEVHPPLPDEGEDILGRICLVHQGSDSSKPAFLNIFDSLHYLKKREPWYGFLNRAYYAVQNDRTMFIWIGVLPEESRSTTEGPRDTIHIPWFKCGKKKSGNHAYKILALSALLDIPNAPEKILFMDSDMFIRFESQYKPFYVIEKNFEDPTVFLIGNSGGSPYKKTLKLMNSGHLGVKNNDAAKRFLALWWQSQCGFKDQLSLHLTLLAWFSSVSTFSFSVRDLGLYNYEKAHEGGKAYYYVEKHINEIRVGDGCPTSPRKPTYPELGFTREKGENSVGASLLNRVLVDDPLCGIVTTHVEQNSYCHCHLDLGRKCMGNCHTPFWPPPYPGAPLGQGTEPEFNMTWYID